MQHAYTENEASFAYNFQHLEQCASHAEHTEERNAGNPVVRCQIGFPCGFHSALSLCGVPVNQQDCQPRSIVMWLLFL